MLLTVRLLLTIVPVLVMQYQITWVNDPSKTIIKKSNRETIFTMCFYTLWEQQDRIWVIVVSEILCNLSSYHSSLKCTHPSHCLRQQRRYSPIQPRDVTIATQRTLLWAHVNGTEIGLKTTDRPSNIYLFLYVQGLTQGLLSLRNLVCILHFSFSDNVVLWRRATGQHIFYTF